MRIAVTGKNGQVVRSLLAMADTGFDIIALGRPDLDLAIPETILPAIAATHADVVISAAAYTAVDQAEDNYDLAFAINATGAGLVSDAAAKLNIPIIHLSTDYVFDGKNPLAYVETDLTNPLNVYGQSKLLGEQAVAASNAQHIILRTSWVYGPYGNNFLKTMLKLSKERSELNVISDQYGSPTSSTNIASLLVKISAELYHKKFNDWGVYHYTDDLVTSWHDWAKYIFEVTESKITLKQTTSLEYKSKAKRPQYSNLSSLKIKKAFNTDSIEWKHSTNEVLKALKLME